MKQVDVIEWLQDNLVIVPAPVLEEGDPVPEPDPKDLTRIFAALKCDYLSNALNEGNNNYPLCIIPPSEYISDPQRRWKKWDVFLYIFKLDQTSGGADPSATERLEIWDDIEDLITSMLKTIQEATDTDGSRLFSIEDNFSVVLDALDLGSDRTCYAKINFKLVTPGDCLTA